MVSASPGWCVVAEVHLEELDLSIESRRRYRSPVGGERSGCDGLKIDNSCEEVIAIDSLCYIQFYLLTY